MSSDSAALERYKVAEERLHEATAAAADGRTALLAAEEKMAGLWRRGGIGRITLQPLIEIESAQRALEEAKAAVWEASDRERQCEVEAREAWVWAVTKHPEHFKAKVASLANIRPELVQDPMAPPDATATTPASMPAHASPQPPRTTVALLFPGQGSQFVGMMGGLKDLPEVIELVRTARSVLGFDPLEVCLNGPEESLEETSVCQPCMFLAGMAGLAKLRKSRPEAVERPGAVAGRSLGEYTALCAAGVFTFREGIELVRIRGSAMAEAAKTRPQAMLSVFGIEKAELEQLCREQAKGQEVCQIANNLFPRGFSCGGTKAAILELKQACDKAGAMQSKLLKTAGGFHTELMRPAQEKLQMALEELAPRMKPPTCDIYINVTGKKIEAGTPASEFLPLLTKQLCSSVLWESSVRLMIEDGLTEFYEVGPMKQLKAMMKRIDLNMWQKTQNVEV